MIDSPLRQTALDAFHAASITYALVALVVMGALMALLLVQRYRDPKAFWAVEDDLAIHGLSPTGAAALIALAWPVIAWHLLSDHEGASA